jgi:hypothetical protein
MYWFMKKNKYFCNSNFEFLYLIRIYVFNIGK